MDTQHRHYTQHTHYTQHYACTHDTHTQTHTSCCKAASIGSTTIHFSYTFLCQHTNIFNNILHIAYHTTLMTLGWTGSLITNSSRPNGPIVTCSERIFDCPIRAFWMQVYSIHSISFNIPCTQKLSKEENFANFAINQKYNHAMLLLIDCEFTKVGSNFISLLSLTR